MNNRFRLIMLSLCLSVSAQAQVFILNDNVLTQRMAEIKTTVLDSLTNEPIPFASVYVVPSKDTTITNFILTDAKGEATLEDVPFGKYVFHVEMMGYKPVVRERHFREADVDMGKIRLVEDRDFLEAAVVSDVGNPVLFKKDTVEFNASSFQVGANAMLKDLIMRMPGMEITEDGKVKFNGEEIDKLTVGGRTFFFDDQSTALNNLPASIVDKIRVIDRESEQTRASGIQDGTREKVMDVALKKEYEKGWFGNAGVKGGTTLSKAEGDSPLRDDRGMLYNANALVSAYSEKDQLTLIANGQNVNESGVVMVMVDDGNDFSTSTLNQGLSSAAQLGVNLNTSRIRDVETTVGANYKYTDTDTGARSERTTYQENGDLSSSSSNTGKNYATSVSANMEFKKEKGNTWFHIRPDFDYSSNSSRSGSHSETSRSGAFVNSSDNSTNSLSDSRYASLDADVTFRDIGGKKGRMILATADGSYGTNSGEISETSVLKTVSGEDRRMMDYISDGNSSSLSGHFRYVEPLGEKWTLSFTGDASFSGADRKRDAFDDAGFNDFYSSTNKSSTIKQTDGLTVQYRFNESSWLTIGGEALGIRQYNFSKNHGVEYETGDKWLWNVTPTVRFQRSKGNTRFNADLSGYSQQPGSSQLLPLLNITDPARLTLGNVYLKPYTSSSAYLSLNSNNPQKYSNSFAYLIGRFKTNPISDAIWYDSDGIMYSIPVNAGKPSVSATFMFSWSVPLDEKKLWTATFMVQSGLSSSTSYQARTTMDGLDKDRFDYSEFMSGFWGNADGDRFYSGKSGFSESSTLNISPSANINLKYRQDRFWLMAGASTGGYISRYSLNPDADMNTLKTAFNIQGDFTTRHEFEFNTDISYVFYKGYSEGYGQPEWQWNAEISKNIGAFILSLKARDILDQTRNLTHTVTANYEEDSYRLVMGRYLLFGIKWNFGKMNAANSQRAQRAAMNMVF